MSSPGRVIDRLADAGFPESFVRASLPDWWTPEGETTAGRTIAALLLARRLSLDPESLLDDNVPIGFLHTGPTKFKHLRLAPGPQLNALTAYCQGVARLVLSIQQPPSEPQELPAALELRRTILESGRDNVGFGDVLSLCWAMGIPVLHIRLFPATTKGLTAMAVRVGHGHVILVARESGVEAQYMFHVAHELGHISLGHVRQVSAIIDADSRDPETAGKDLVRDEEEEAADEFAQELLTGVRSFRVDRAILEGSDTKLGTARELANKALLVGQELGVDPGHVAMCFGDSTGEWGLAQNAVKLLPRQPEKPGTLVNRVLWQQLGSNTEDQSISFLRAVAPE